MPGLYLFGRKWAFASDDLPFLAFFGAVFHGAWLLLILSFSLYAHSVDRPQNCEGAAQLAAFMACLLLSLSVSTVCDILIFWHGVKGAIFQSSFRKHVNIVMYILTFNFLLKICITSYGTYLVFIHQPRCLEVTTELEKVMKAVIISTWIIILLYILVSVISYQAFPKNSVLQWKRRIRFVNWCCCGSFHQMESEPLAHMALVFENFFKPMDFSATDTLIAMILASKYQTFTRHRPQDKSSTSQSQGSLSEPVLIPFIQMVNRGIATTPSSFEPLSPIGNLELKSTKLAPVMENDELEIMDEGQSSELSIMNENVHQSMFIDENHVEPSSSEASLVNRPRHRRNDAIDFSQLELDYTIDSASEFQWQNPHSKLDMECELELHQEQQQEQQQQQCLDEDPSVDWDVENQNHQISEASVSAQNEKESLTCEVASLPESEESAETTLTWDDDYAQTFLIPAEDGITSCLAPSLPSVDYDTLERMHLYHRYALASYGALLYLASGKRFVDQCGRCCGLCIRAAPPPSLVWSKTRENTSYFYPQKEHDAFQSSSKSPSLINRLNNEAVLLHGFEQKDILYRSHEDVLAGHLPYFVALDGKEESIVIAVRGTLSWQDIVTDFLIQPATLDDEECQQVNHLLGRLYGPNHGRMNNLSDYSVHSGMLQSARGLLSNLEKVGILDILKYGKFPHINSIDTSCGSINGDDGDEQMTHNLAQWKFVMTGHSLGAGVVSLATLLLKSRFPSKEIECFCISPPACVMNAELASAVSPFCLSLVHGKDIVPRISVLTAERLRDQMVRAATLCKKSKMGVLWSVFCKKDLNENELFYTPEELDAEPLDALKQYKTAVKHSEKEDNLNLARKFIPPGKIVFLRPRKKQLNPETTSSLNNSSRLTAATASVPNVKIKSGKTKIMRSFEAVWISGKDLTQEGILLSLSMIKDHFPFFSIESLKEVIEERRGYC